MTFEEAKKILTKADRYELRDHAFGDRELTWYEADTEKEVASGYVGGGGWSVSINDPSNSENSYGFDGDEAKEMVKLGTLKRVSRNDSTGPAIYRDGICMPGLTLGGVLKEITTPPIFKPEKCPKGHSLLLGKEFTPCGTDYSGKHVNDLPLEEQCIRSWAEYDTDLTNECFCPTCDYSYKRTDWKN